MKSTILFARRMDKSCSLNLAFFFFFFCPSKRVQMRRGGRKKLAKLLLHRQVRYACINEEFALYSVIVEAKLAR